MSEITIDTTMASTQRGDGTVKGILSVDVSDWQMPGPRTGKVAARVPVAGVVAISPAPMVTTYRDLYGAPKGATRARGWPHLVP